MPERKCDCRTCDECWYNQGLEHGREESTEEIERLKNALFWASPKGGALRERKRIFEALDDPTLYDDASRISHSAVRAAILGITRETPDDD